MTDRSPETGSLTPETPLADQLGQLLQLVASTDVEVLEVQHDGARFVIRRDLSGDRAAPPVVQPLPEPELPPRAESFVITAPCVGVFRRTAGGAAETALEPGDAVTAGQVVGAVEAMGMLNRVQSERAGMVQSVLVREGQPVEYGQSLLVIYEP